MKKTLLTRAINILNDGSYAQVTTTNGNTATMDDVGIGGVTNPHSKLDERGEMREYLTVATLQC